VTDKGDQRRAMWILAATLQRYGTEQVNIFIKTGTNLVRWNTIYDGY
jgi:hypothetical protein